MAREGAGAGAAEPSADAAAAAGPEGAAASDPQTGAAGSDTQTAFRQAEKAFKLFVPVKDRKKRRPKPVQEATPQLSAAGHRVHNLHDPDCAAELLAQGLVNQHHVPTLPLDTQHLSAPAIQQHEPLSSSCQQTGAQDGAPQLCAYTWQAHPGLLLVPGALTGPQQLSLARAAFTLYPEPPAHTNHERQYGHLPGLWTAAQQDLVLRPEVQRAANKQQATSVAPQQGPYAQSEDTGNTQPKTQQQQHAGLVSGVNGVGTAPHGCASQGGGSLQAVSGSVCGEQGSGARTYDDCWCVRDPRDAALPAGAPRAMDARTLLHRLRHAVLGPVFDWTARCYRPNVPHRQLPAALRDFATHWGRVASELHPQQPTHHPGTTPHAQGHTQSHRAPFQPDAALVHFYYAGDTLMGHRDDVEPDLTQPIVSISLGCDAVFLMGGDTKDEEPTPILLRSGDVLVLGGRARCCYHGVPRVFTECVSPSLEQAATDTPDMQPFADHLTTCRINISVRSVCSDT